MSDCIWLSENQLFPITKESKLHVKWGSCLQVASDSTERVQEMNRQVITQPTPCNVWCANEWPCAEIPLRLLSIPVKPSPASFQIPGGIGKHPPASQGGGGGGGGRAEGGQWMHWQLAQLPTDTQLPLPQWLLSFGLSWNAQQEQKVPFPAQDIGGQCFPSSPTDQPARRDPRLLTGRGTPCTP